MSDLTHSSISRRDSKIYHARGLQITSKKSYPLLIGGETNTHSYLAFSKSENIYIMELVNISTMMKLIV